MTDTEMMALACLGVLLAVWLLLARLAWHARSAEEQAMAEHHAYLREQLWQHLDEQAARRADRRARRAALERGGR